MELSLTSPPPLLVVVLLLALLLQLFHCLRCRDPRKQPRAPGLKVYLLLGTLPHLVKNRHRFLEWSTGVLQRSPTRVIKGRHVPEGVNQICYSSRALTAVGFGGGVITANPANVEHFLSTNFGNYPKGELTVSMVEDLLGGGIFNSDGDRWLWQRKAASHEFSTRSLRGFVADAVRFEAAERLLPLLTRAARDGRTLDVQDVLQRFALDNICSSAVMARLMSRPRSLWRVRRLLNTESERRTRAAVGKIRAYAGRIVRERRERVEAGLARGDDLLSRFAARGDHSDDSLRDVVTNFLLAGRDTTSSALT
ncbi:Cytochrome P450 94B1 [Dichanthelium oligosanthes]|uniref:Cytochrome P450 94B1 n=1 Tax=Dichanthelium oligosanthes TaxID=888268 RepID=A0A1E5UXK6_9POAL|nr:Cytochrome P450 94B1 [Dichanthelium oligosanthes]